MDTLGANQLPACVRNYGSLSKVTTSFNDVAIRMITNDSPSRAQSSPTGISQQVVAQCPCWMIGTTASSHAKHATSKTFFEGEKNDVRHVFKLKLKLK